MRRTPMSNHQCLPRWRRNSGLAQGTVSPCLQCVAEIMDATCQCICLAGLCCIACAAKDAHIACNGGTCATQVMAAETKSQTLSSQLACAIE